MQSEKRGVKIDPTLVLKGLIKINWILIEMNLFSKIKIMIHWILKWIFT